MIGLLTSLIVQAVVITVQLMILTVRLMIMGIVALSSLIARELESRR